MSGKGNWHMSPDGVARRCSAAECPFGDVIHGSSAADVYKQDEMSRSDIRVPLPMSKKKIPAKVRDTGVEDLAYRPQPSELRNRLVSAHGYSDSPDNMQFAEYTNQYHAGNRNESTFSENEIVSFAINDPNYNYATIDKHTTTKKYIQFKGYKEEYSADKVRKNQRMYGELAQKINDEDKRAADFAKMSSLRVLMTTGRTKKSLISGIREANNHRNTMLKNYAQYLHPKVVYETTSTTNLYMHNTEDYKKEAFDYSSNRKVQYKTPPVKVYDVPIETSEDWRKDKRNFELIRDFLKEKQ